MPETLLVQTEGMEQALKSFTKDLGIKLKRVDYMPAYQEAMNAMLNRRLAVN
jgi:hypothetical protein